MYTPLCPWCQNPTRPTALGDKQQQTSNLWLPGDARGRGPHPGESNEQQTELFLAFVACLALVGTNQYPASPLIYRSPRGESERTFTQLACRAVWQCSLEGDFSEG